MLLRALGFITACALTACAASYAAPGAIAYRPPAPPPPSVSTLYAAAPRAPLHSELFACTVLGSNIGALGERGQSLLYTPYIYTAAGALLRTPTEAACLSSGFGWRGAASGGGRAHNGLDLANPGGGFVFAAGDGWIASADWRNGYGNVVEIDHGGGVRTSYAHLSEIDPNLQPGGFVTAGTAIGRMGMTGNATGVHLHYEVAVDGLLVDPLAYGAPPSVEEKPVM